MTDKMIHHHEITQKTPTPEIDQDVLDLAQRIRAVMRDSDTNLDVLRDLAADPASRERFDELLDDVAAEAAILDPEFVENIRKLRKNPATTANSIRERQRQIFETHKNAVLAEAGLSAQDATPQLDLYKQQIRKKVKEILIADPESKVLSVLEGLGIITHTGDKDTYVYPEGLFPPSVDQKWHAYLSVVARHLKSARDVQLGIGQSSKEDVVANDRARRLAHNAAAKDVHYLLGLDTLPNDTWDFERTRGLLDKMRDNLLPDLNSSERSVTEKAIARGAAGAHAVQALTRIAMRNQPSYK